MPNNLVNPTCTFEPQSERNEQLIKFLSEIGRFAVIVSAAITIIAGGILGYMVLGVMIYADATVPAASEGTMQIWGMAFGLIGGIIASGAIFGPIAALYDIRDNIRRTTQQLIGVSQPKPQAIEPQLAKP